LSFMKASLLYTTAESALSAIFVVKQCPIVPALRASVFFYSMYSPTSRSGLLHSGPPDLLVFSPNQLGGAESQVVHVFVE
jgi:hypothetical protein